VDTLTSNFAGGHPRRQNKSERTSSSFVSCMRTRRGASKNTPKFVSFFSDDGYFYDVAAGKRYYGQEIGDTVDIYAKAFPDIHRELYRCTSPATWSWWSFPSTARITETSPYRFGVVPPTHKRCTRRVPTSPPRGRKGQQVSLLRRRADPVE